MTLFAPKVAGMRFLKIVRHLLNYFPKEQAEHRFTQMSSSQTTTSPNLSILMNRTLRYLLLLALALAVMPRAQAQGFVKFNNRVIGAVVAPIYGTNPIAPTLALCGNAVTNGGTQNYFSHPLVFGTIYTAELWAGPLGTPDAALTLPPPRPS